MTSICDRPFIQRRKRMIRIERLVAMAAALAVAGSVASAQRPPGPEPTVPPTPQLPIPKRGEDLVLNPTAEECRKGWQPGLKWTKKQFDDFCSQLEISR
jgi:hypothetical protein